jgi:hypothetical protein
VGPFARPLRIRPRAGSSGSRSGGEADLGSTPPGPDLGVSPRIGRDSLRVDLGGLIDPGPAPPEAGLGVSPSLEDLGRDSLVADLGVSFDLERAPPGAELGGLSRPAGVFGLFPDCWSTATWSLFCLAFFFFDRQGPMIDYQSCPFLEVHFVLLFINSTQDQNLDQFIPSPFLGGVLDLYYVFNYQDLELKHATSSRDRLTAVHAIFGTALPYFFCMSRLKRSLSADPRLVPNAAMIEWS